LGGGSWNNNQTNARAAARNRNDIHNRNNAIGFRLLCSVHIPLRTRRPAGPADLRASQLTCMLVSAAIW
jgi:hypothetical protein